MLASRSNRLRGACCALLLALSCLGTAPLSAQLFELDSYQVSSWPFGDPVGPPVVTALHPGRFVTAQLRQKAFYTQVDVRVWGVDSSGDITLLDDDFRILSSGATVHDVAALGTSAFVVAVRNPVNLRMIIWDVDGSGNLSLREVGGNISSTGKVELEEQSSTSVLVMLANSVTGQVELRRWRNQNGSVVMGTLASFGTPTDYAVSLHGSEVAVATLDGSIGLFRAAFAAEWSLTGQRTATGASALEVDVTFTAGGSVATASRTASGFTTVTRWADLTLWPTTVKILTPVSSASAFGALQGITTAPLLTSRVGVTGIDSGNVFQVHSWEASSPVSLLDSAAGDVANAVDMARLSHNRVVTVSRSIGPPQLVTVWQDL